MNYSQEALEDMSQKIDLLDYASRSVDFVKHSGNTHYAICPFHTEKTASLAVDEDRQFFFCFGCGKNGNIFTWIQLTENMTFDQAVQKVADLTGTDPEEHCESETVSFYKLMNNINSVDNARAVNRIILDIEKDYNDKYADELPQEWIDEGISQDVMKKYEIRIDSLANRIVYPVYDQNLQLIGIKGRTRFKNFKDLKIMKYINYRKIGVLDYFAGMKQAESYIKQSDEIIIFEGLKSVMKVDQWGFHNAVSAETSTLNEYQIELLLKMRVKNVVIAFDKDIDVHKIRKCTELLKKFTNVWVVYDKWKLLDDKDSPPDKGRDVWETLYERRIKL